MQCHVQGMILLGKVFQPQQRAPTHAPIQLTNLLLLGGQATAEEHGFAGLGWVPMSGKHAAVGPEEHISVRR
jgi:hypothetical protein